MEKYYVVRSRIRIITPLSRIPTQIYEYDFHENGIGVDDRFVAGGMARGIAAIGANYIAVGIHTGTIVLFEVSTDQDSFICRIADSQRMHSKPVTDLASTTTSSESMKDVMQQRAKAKSRGRGRAGGGGGTGGAAAAAAAAGDAKLARTKVRKKGPPMI